MPGPTRLERRLTRSVGEAIRDFALIAPGDRVAVAVSGGKDSYGLLHLLLRMRVKAPVDFDLVALHLDQGQPGYDGAPLEAWLKERQVPYRIVRRDTYSVVMGKVEAGKTYCSLCSRLRRGILYDQVVDLGCNKLALGHHRDDSIETLVLNLVFAGQLKAMPPKLRSDDGRNTVIRPLMYCAEEDLRALAVEQGFPILPCNLCGSQDNLQRQNVKELLRQFQALHPRSKESILAAMGNVRPSHLLDPGLWGRLGLSVATEAEARGGWADEWTDAALPARDEGTAPGADVPAGGRNHLVVLG